MDFFLPAVSWRTRSLQKVDIRGCTRISFGHFIAPSRDGWHRMCHPGCTQSVQTPCQAKDWLRPGRNMLEVFLTVWILSLMALFVFAKSVVLTLLILERRMKLPSSTK